MNISRWIYLVVLGMAAGCGSRPVTVAIRGEVSFDGQPVAQGQVAFVPIENTPGASAVGVVNAGWYEIPVQGGLRPDGVYSVRVVAYRKTGKKDPNPINRGGPPVDVEESYIPPMYNSQSTLKLRVADVADKNNVDFQLGSTSLPAGR